MLALPWPYRLLFGLSLLAFAALAVTGAGFAWRQEGGVPGPAWNHWDAVETALQAQDVPRAAALLARIGHLDLERGPEAYRTLAEVAARTGDRDGQVAALRAVAGHWSATARDRQQLAFALLSQPSPAPAELAEAEALAQRILEDAPHDALALLNLGSVAWHRGAHDQAEALWERAGAADPRARARTEAIVQQRHPGRGEAGS